LIVSSVRAGHWRCGRGEGGLRSSVGFHQPRWLHHIASRTHRGRGAMKLRKVWIAPGFLAALALCCGTAGAADKSKVDQATKRVQRGAKQIGQGQIGPGFKELFTGIGHTIVEGAKWSGENVKEFFTSKK